MATSRAFLLFAALQALGIASTVSVRLTNTEAVDIRGQNFCPSSSCGHLQDIRHPFRMQGDPPSCGFQEYELVCMDGKAIIHINTGRYFVTHIFYYYSVFWVVDATLDNSSCPVPERNQSPHLYGLESKDLILLDIRPSSMATFVSCSEPQEKNVLYRPVACRTTNSSFVYVFTNSFVPLVGYIEPSCRYLSMIPLGSNFVPPLEPFIAKYEYVVKSMRNGFIVNFPIEITPMTSYHNHQIINICMNDVKRYFYDISNIVDQSQSHAAIFGIDIYAAIFGIDIYAAIFGIDIQFLTCVSDYSYDTKLFWSAVAIVSAVVTVKFMIVLAILSRLVLAPLAVLTFLAYKYWKTKISVDAVEKFLQMQQTLSPTRYAYTDITAITGHFRDKLGQGGYGSVYKGVLAGDVYVAVKMLGNSFCNGDEFINEVATIGSIHHVNIVRLVGFCSEEMKRARVYEYMPLGSLDKYIFSSERSFSWDKLNDIALGIARGINYLHGGCEMQIVHFDIKPHNILLDNNFTPKIADFGLAKLYPRDKSFVPVSAARGTIGYIAPEMISRNFGVVSCKSDVYSFGMLLLEMAGGRRNLDQHADRRSQMYYPAWVYNQLSRNEVDDISEAVNLHEVERKLCLIGLWCIQMKSHDRPTMGEVIEMLESSGDDLQIPAEPFFCGDERSSVTDAFHFSSELSAISEIE